MKPSVYIETTIPSYLTAWPSRDLIRAGHQQLTREWRLRRRADFELYTSRLVLVECEGGDPEAAAARLEVLKELGLLEQSLQATELADTLARNLGLPPKALPDALHIGISAVHGMRYLLTWTCTHIANATFRPTIDATCKSAGFEPPLICTPEELLGGSDDD